MSIQQSINQALGIGALLASQSPMAAAHKEKVLNQAAIKDADKANEASKIALSKQFKANEKTDPVTNKLATEAAKNTAQGIKYIKDILGNPNSTYTVRNTKAFGDVLDVRLPDGTGARWTADGKTFLGFLEKYTN